MSRFTKTALRDAQGLLRDRPHALALLLVLMVPMVAGVFQQTAHARQDIRAVRAAIVNEDKIVSATGPDGKKTPVAVGRLLAANLVSNTSNTNFDWVLTNRSDASSGLKDGTYGAVLTIPRSVSAAAISTAGDDPKQATIQIQTDDATSFLNGQIARTVGRAAIGGVNNTVTQGYLDNVYIGFGTIKTAVEEASTGASKLSAGASQVASGADQIDGGVGQLSGGLAQLADRTESLPRDARKLSDGSSQLATGSEQLATGTGQLADGTARLTDGLNQFGNGMDQLVANCPGLILYQRYCDGVAEARDGAKQIAAKSVLLRNGAADLDEGAAKLAGGARQLSDGTSQFAEQAPQLHDAIAQASTGADRLKTGTAQLSDGAGQLASGTDRLEGGLVKGKDQVPTYTAGEREKLSKIVAEPMSADTQRSNPLASANQARIPFALVLSAVLGALALIALLPKRSGRMLLSNASSWRVVRRRHVITGSVVAGQTILAVVAVAAVSDIGAARPTQFALVALVAAMTFAVLVQVIIEVFGRPVGVYLAVGWMFLQVMTLDPSRPSESLSGPARIIHDLSPMAAAIDGLTAAQTGGASIATPMLQLIMWTALALLVTVAAVHRRRTRISELGAAGSSAVGLQV